MYVVICLFECWIDKGFTMDGPDYKAKIFPRKSKPTQGGGSVILIKSKYTPYISVVESLYHTIIRLKLFSIIPDKKCHGFSFQSSH